MQGTSKQVGGVFVLVALVVTGGWLAAQARPQQDPREAVIVTAEQRDMMLAEMRGLLVAVNGVLNGVASGDTAQAREAAAAVGMEAMRRAHASQPAQPASATPSQPKPEGWRKLGPATHIAFDSLAHDLAQGASAGRVVSRLATLTNNCVACHAAYRLEVR